MPAIIKVPSVTSIAQRIERIPSNIFENMIMVSCCCCCCCRRGWQWRVSKVVCKVVGSPLHTCLPFPLTVYFDICSFYSINKVGSELYSPNKLDKLKCETASAAVVFGSTAALTKRVRISETAGTFLINTESVFGTEVLLILVIIMGVK